TLGPSCHLPWPVNCEVAVGKIAVGPAPRTQLPECAGDSNSTNARSPSPASRANSPGDVSCGTMLQKGITGRVIRFQSLVRLTGITGWKFQLLFHWPLFSSKLLNWFEMDQMLLTGLVSSLFSSLADGSAAVDSL